VSEPFGAAYAAVYDLLYAEKDYDREVDLVEEAFRRFGDGAIRDVVDVGCGTGGHLLRLAARGYRVTGVDVAEAMIDVARRKADAEGLPVDLRVGDARALPLEGTYDAALLLFAVLGYMTGNDDVLAALRSARAHLRPGGLLYLDAWHGPHVLAEPPQDAERVIGGLTRSAVVDVDVRRHLCSVHYRLAGAASSEETHVVRFFFPRELELFLETTGFRPVVLSEFGSLDSEPSSTTRTVVAVAQAV
jgi:SAM-dependent methyltransferase